MENLIFQLDAPLASWGEIAVGEYRPSADYPGQAAIHGLLAAALGITREDEPALRALAASYRMAVGVLGTGRLLRDYQTAQVPSRADLKKRPHATRRDELALPKHDLNTILSTRDYRQDAAALIVIQASAGTAYSLRQLADALEKPRFVLYLGRKSCPLAQPASPRIIEADTVRAALSAYQQQLAARWQELAPGVDAPAAKEVQKIAWSDDFGADDQLAIGALRDLSVVRRDKMIARRGWQFADRYEHIALFDKE